MTRWICSQWGARERYAIPRALHLIGKLDYMLTDIWVTPKSPLNRVVAKARGRYHSELSNANIMSFTNYFVARQAVLKLTGGENLLDHIFDLKVAQILNSKKYQSEPGIFFGYSYSSLQSLKTAKKHGYRTVLGQINPGPGEAMIVEEQYTQFRNGRYKALVPPMAYWNSWDEEVSNADKIVVNSEWAKSLLMKAGVNENKCVVIPLAYSNTDRGISREFHRKFENQSPLKLLYLGAVSLRKGFHHLREAMEKMARLPVHLDVVGALRGPKELLENLPSNITYHGAVTPSEVNQFYRNADLFVFPTLSDGFGLTQLEAQSYKLPLMTTPYCADVITDRVNGMILQYVNADTIRLAVEEILDQPELLEIFSQNSISMEKYSVQKLASALNDLSQVL